MKMKRILKLFIIFLIPSQASLSASCGAPNGHKINAYWNSIDGKKYNLYNKNSKNKEISKINDSTNLTSGIIIPSVDFLNSTIESRQTNNNLTKQQISQCLQEQQANLTKQNPIWTNFYKSWNSSQDFSYSKIALNSIIDGKLTQIDKIKVMNLQATSKKDEYEYIYGPSYINTIKTQLDSLQGIDSKIFKNKVKTSLLVNFSNPDLNKGVNFQFYFDLTFKAANYSYTFKVLLKNLALSFLLVDTKAKKKKKNSINLNDDKKPEYQWFFIGYYFVPFNNPKQIKYNQYKQGEYFPTYQKYINDAWGIQENYGIEFVNKHFVKQAPKKSPFEYLLYNIVPNSITKTKN